MEESMNTLELEVSDNQIVIEHCVSYVEALINHLFWLHKGPPHNELPNEHFACRLKVSENELRPLKLTRLGKLLTK